jgi:tRNA G18 (ribose-2'-O)-methylase SpoU
LSITLKKFLKLPYKTRCNRVSDLLESYREKLLDGDDASSEEIDLIETLLNSSEDLGWAYERFKSSSTTRRTRVEAAHLLIHSLKEETGYPISEKSFLQIRSDSKDVIPKKSQLIVIVENLRSAFNVGSIIRSCECFGVKKLIISGYTPDLGHISVQKTAKGATNLVDVEKSSDLIQTLEDLKSEGYSLVAAETATDSYSLYDYKFSEKSAIIFGNEEIGITERVLSKVDSVVEIPMRGVKNSINVGSAAAILINSYTGQIYG